jgi:hypothetical protein
MKNCHFLDGTPMFSQCSHPHPGHPPVLIGTARRQRKILTSWMIMGNQKWDGDLTNYKSWLVVEPLKNISRLDDYSRYMEKYVFFSKPPTTIQNLTIQKTRNFTNNDWDFYHPINWILTNNNWEFKHAKNVGMPQNRDSEIRLNHCILGGNPKHPKR